jgi:hypothetical protein
VISSAEHRTGAGNPPAAAAVKLAALNRIVKMAFVPIGRYGFPSARGGELCEGLARKDRLHSKSAHMRRALCLGLNEAVGALQGVERKSLRVRGKG